MNIYIHVEVAARELDSKLLLALCAAERGHEVLVGCHETIRFMVKKSLFKPGFFHAKDITPRENKIGRHQKLVDRGFKISSMDEEGRLISWDYEPFARSRFAEKTLEQTGVVFCWGEHDRGELKRIYPRFEKIFISTGSTRADLWLDRFAQFWGVPEDVPSRPFVLFSSNFGFANNYQRFWEIVKGHKKSGYFERVPAMEKEMYTRCSEQTMMVYEFVKAIEFLARNRPDIDVVVRPHPVEDPESWKALLNQAENIHVIRTGPITPWVNNAAAVVHNGCTTALEATVAGKPLITYAPYVQAVENEVPNSLGIKVASPEELLKAVNSILENDPKNDDLMRGGVEIVAKKINFQGTELAADRMVNAWESLADESWKEKNDWKAIRRALRLKNMKNAAARSVFKIIGKKYKDRYERVFPPLSLNEIERKVELLKKCIGKGEKVRVELLDKRTILFRRKD